MAEIDLTWQNMQLKVIKAAFAKAKLQINSHNRKMLAKKKRFVSLNQTRKMSLFNCKN